MIAFFFKCVCLIVYNKNLKSVSGGRTRCRNRFQILILLPKYNIYCENKHALFVMSFGKVIPYILMLKNEKCLFSNTHELDIIFW